MIYGVIPVVTVVLFFLSVLIFIGLWVDMIRDAGKPFVRHATVKEIRSAWVEVERVYRVRGFWLILIAIMTILGTGLWFWSVF